MGGDALDDAILPAVVFQRLESNGELGESAIAHELQDVVGTGSLGDSELSPESASFFAEKCGAADG